MAKHQDDTTSALVEFVNDNFTPAQRNQLTLLGVINEDGTLNVDNLQMKNMEMKPKETEIKGQYYAVLGYLQVKTNFEQHLVTIQKKTDGSIAANTRVSYQGNFKQTVPWFTNEDTRRAWAQLIAILPKYAEIAGLVK